MTSSELGTTQSFTLDRLHEIVDSLLDLDGVVLTADTRPSDVPGWDSLANVSIVFAVEEEFDVELTAEQLKGSATLGEFARGIDDLVASRRPT